MSEKLFYFQYNSSSTMEETLQATLSSQQNFHWLRHMPPWIVVQLQTPHAPRNNLIWNMKRYIYIFLSFVLFSSTLPLNISLILGCYGYFGRMLSLYNFEHTFIVILSGYQLPFLPAYFILGSNLDKCLFSVCILKAVQILQKAND